MKKILFLLAIILSASYSFSQTNLFSNVYKSPPLAPVRGNAIAKTLDKGFLIVGTYSTGGLIYKIDSTGNDIWQRSYHIPPWSQVSFTDIKPTSDSCFIITGSTPNPISMTSDLVCMKINTNGDTLWCKAIIGNSGLEGNSIEETFDHGFIIAGTEYNNFNPPYSMVAVKLDSIGNLEWKRTLTFENHYNLGVSIKQLPDSSYLFLASVIDNISINHSNLVLINLSPSGEIIWSKQYNRSITVNYTGIDLLVLPTGIISYTSDSGYMALMKTDFTGNVLWSKRYSARVINPCVNCGNSNINPVSDGGYIITNGQAVPTVTYDSKILKLDSAFNIQWSRNVLSSPVEAIETDDKGLILLTGPPNNSNTASYFGIVKMDSAGNDFLSCTSPAIDSSFNVSIYTSVIYLLTTDSGGISYNFNPSMDIAWVLPDTGCISPDMPWGIKEANTNSYISIFPNPFTFQTTISFNEEQINTILRIIDLSGKMIKTYSFTGKQLTIERGEMMSGIYFVQIISENKNVTTKKIVIQ